MHTTAPSAPAETVASPPTPEQLLARFGLDEFRPGQREAVEAALAGRDSLVVMPTGGGKSLCYQLPALAGAGLVVVVSPLIALMADQLRRLQQAGVRSAMLASGMQEGHNAEALSEIEAGSTQVVLAAPERFASAAFRQALSRRSVALFVVDEAHCVAEWGHDFRPDYLRLHDAIGACRRDLRQVGRPAVMAATATATPRVAEEIAQRLGLRQWLSIRSGFDRPNLTFDVAGLQGKGALARKRSALMHVLDQPAATPAIVYCGTRKDTEELVDALARRGVAAVAYHAGMTSEARQHSQAAFMDGAADVVVATSAFGMGVDKADVRTVVHWALPTSLEAYYQEAGRAGRDGAPARALLLAARSDLGRLISFITRRQTSLDEVRRYVNGLRSAADSGVAVLAYTDVGDHDRVLLSIAERAGAVELAPGGRDGLVVTLTGHGSPRLAQLAIKAASDRAWESYRSIERFSAEGQTCRRRQILDHFGDASEAVPTVRCCDVCAPDPGLAHAVNSSGASGRGVRPATAGRRGHAMNLALEPLQEPRFEALRAWRKDRAQGKPAFTVTTDSVLEAVLGCRPRSLAELLEIKGIGPSFCDKHGESLLAELAALD